MKRAALALALGFAATSSAAAQDSAVAQHAESLRQAGRPWHAASVLLLAASHGPVANVNLIVQGAEAELAARSYDRARSLLVGQPWLEDYDDGEALAVLAEAEARLGDLTAAATHFSQAQTRARGPRAALLAVRAGHAWDRAGERDSAAQAYALARSAGLSGIDSWLRIRLAGVLRDTTRSFALLAELSPAPALDVPEARARGLLAAGDTAQAISAFAQAGRQLDVARLSLAAGDSAAARTALFGLMARSPESDPAAAAVGIATASLGPRTPAERVALARAMKFHGAAADATTQVERAVQAGDSSGSTMLLLGELSAGAGRYTRAELAYRVAAKDSLVRALATYRRARLLARIGDGGALQALAGFAQAFPTDTGAPTALSIAADVMAGRGDTAAATRSLADLIARYPTDPRASQARLRLAAAATQRGLRDSAAALYQSEVTAGSPQRLAARYWLGRTAAARGDTASARAAYVALAHDDSLGYYGMCARRAASLPSLRMGDAARADAPPEVVQGLAVLDTLELAGLDSEAQAEVRLVMMRPPLDLDALLGWSEGLAVRGWGPAAVRLAWMAALRSPNNPRVLRAIFPWPGRAAFEAEASEFGVDPLLLVALVRQESVFDPDALSPAGARGLAQLLPGTAAFTARTLDVSFDPEWITVPDLNLHLGAAHLADLQRRFRGRLDAAVAAYNAGVPAVQRWLKRPGADDPDAFVDLIPYQETRGYVRAVLRNRELYGALYDAPTN